MDSVKFYECTILFSPKHAYLLTWKDVMGGKQIEVQMWRKDTQFLSVFLSYTAAYRTTPGISALIYVLCSEIYGDRIHVFHLQYCHNCTINLHHNRTNHKFKKKTLKILLETHFWNEQLKQL